MPSAFNELFWFSHYTKEYEVLGRTFLIKSDMPEIKLDWDNCTVNLAEIFPNSRKARFVIRSKTNRNSDYMGDIPVELRYMLGVDIPIDSISEVMVEKGYHVSASERRRLPESVKQTEHDRWVFRLGDKAEVWEWAKEKADVRSSRVYELREEIRKGLEAPGEFNKEEEKDGNIFRVDAEKLDQIIPVIYQPAVDSLGNFLREVHIGRKASGNSVDVEVSLLFNNEQLRRFALFNAVYRWFRKLLYGRQIDIESFRIHFEKDLIDKNYFIFKGIYSGDHTLESDTVHMDNEGEQKRFVKYYFVDQYHPIVFINTSNHAMAQHDNNHDLWKWEYLPWVKKAPIKLGSKTRMDLDREYKPIFGSNKSIAS